MQDIKDICERIVRIESLAPLIGSTVLLTGSNGFLGKYFTKVFEELSGPKFGLGIKVILMDNYIVPNTQSESRFLQVQHDISKPFQLNGKIDFVINCAGIASPKFYAQFPLQTLNVSVDGTKNVLDFAVQNHARVMLFSSSEIYQTPDEANIPTKETYVGQIFPNNERSVYDIGKLVLENLAYIYNTRMGGNVVIVRPFNFYGSLMGQTDGRVLPAFREKINKDQTITINGTGQQTRSFTHIVDAIDGCFRALLKGKKGEAYNIGNPSTETSMVNLLKTVEKVLGKKLNYTVNNNPENYKTEPLRRVPDISKARTELRYEPLVSLEEGIKRFFEI